MALGRYLMFVSYLGRPFKGCQRLLKRSSTADDPFTIQGRLEMGLKMLNPTNYPAVYTSSRTDAGVSAFSSAFHVDLFRDRGLVYEPKTVTLCLNKYFSKEQLPIRILKTFMVPEGFHCRYRARSRTYLYRLGVVKAAGALDKGSILFPLPIEETDRCHFVCTDRFDLDAVKAVAGLFVGNRDFRTFMGKETYYPDKMTRRTVLRMEVCEGRDLTYGPYSWAPFNGGTLRDECTFLDVYIQGTGFLWRQVRRMVAVLVAVGQGKLTFSDVKCMLEVPSCRSWDDRVKILPAYPLYLCEVEYSAEDKATFLEEVFGVEGQQQRQQQQQQQRQ